MDINILNGIIVSITGVWLITMCFIMTTRNVKSSLIFKVIPFFLGVGCLFVASNLLGLFK